MTHTRHEVEVLQHALNDFFRRRLRGYSPLIVDGKIGVMTNKRVMTAKFYLGYGNKRAADFTDHLIKQLLNPMDKHHFEYKDDGNYELGIQRRETQRKVWEDHQHPSQQELGELVWKDGHYVVRWIGEINDEVRHAGHWQGYIESGWRSPEYSEHLCEVMCGAPTCPGRCAGKSTNHAKKGFMLGAEDVTDYVTFRSELHRLDLWGQDEPGHLCNILPNDPVHFSAHGN
jgi:hypothetical protein